MSTDCVATDYGLNACVCHSKAWKWRQPFALGKLHCLLPTFMTRLGNATARDDGDEYEARRRASTLFVGDLPGHARSEDLVALFSGLAPVAEVKVISGQGFGFVTFMDPQMAADILAVRSHAAPAPVTHLVKVCTGQLLLLTAPPGWPARPLLWGHLAAFC